MQKPRNELKDLRQFGLALGGISGVLGLVYFLKGRANLYPSFFGIGVVAVFLAFAAPKILKPVYMIFTKVTHVIGWFNTRVILILIYFIFVTPIAFIMKICGNDLLNRKIDKNALTYWVKRPVTRPAKESLEKQF